MRSCIQLQTFYRQLIFIDIYKKIYNNKFLMTIDILKRSKIFRNYTMYLYKMIILYKFNENFKYLSILIFDLQKKKNQY